MSGKNLRKIMQQLLLMFLYVEKKYPAYIAKNNSNHEEQVILLMIWNEGHKANIHGRWHYLAVKKLSALLRGITSKHHGDFYCLNCFHSFTTEKKTESYKKVCEYKDLCNVMLFEDTKMI